MQCGDAPAVSAAKGEGELVGKAGVDLGPPLHPLNCSETEGFQKQRAWRECTEGSVMYFATAWPPVQLVLQLWCGGKTGSGWVVQM